MSIGSKILELRKMNNLSQEELAEKLNVTRQTISKWELDETCPDINSAKQLSMIFRISLDDLVDNDIKNIVVEKVNNTEKLAGIIIQTLRLIGIFSITLFIIAIVISIILFLTRSKELDPSTTNVTMACEIADESYLVNFTSDGYLECNSCTDKMKISLMDQTDWSDMEKSIENITTYFNTNDGDCRVMSSEQTAPVN